MALFEVGRLCVKLAGRDAGLKCVIVDIIDNTYVLVDGETRRKKVNVLHLDPLEEVLEIKAGASHEEVKKALSKQDITVRESKPKQAAPKAMQQRKTKQKPAAETQKAVKKAPVKKKVSKE